MVALGVWCCVLEVFSVLRLVFRFVSVGRARLLLVGVRLRLACVCMYGVLTGTGMQLEVRYTGTSRRNPTDEHATRPVLVRW